jgi:hypothetical protein
MPEDMVPRHRPIKTWFLTHFFRTWTAALTVAGLCLAYVYKPEWLTWWMRSTMAGIESVSSFIPYPWGDRLEVALRTIGGSFWIQITIAVIAVRVITSSLAFGYRKHRARRKGRRLPPAQ